MSTCRATDADAGPNAVLRYSLIGGNTQGHFVIDSLSGDVAVVQPLDYEVLRNYRLVIRAQGDLYRTSPFLPVNYVNMQMRWMAARVVFAVLTVVVSIVVFSFLFLLHLVRNWVSRKRRGVLTDDEFSFERSKTTHRVCGELFKFLARMPYRDAVPDKSFSQLSITHHSPKISISKLNKKIINSRLV